MIVIDSVSKSYGPVRVVDAVSATIPKGGLTVIIGPNGAGKSTLMSIVARLMQADAGRVTVDGMDVARTKSDLLARRLAILRQDNHVTARLTVNDLVAFGRFPHTHGRMTADDRVHIDGAITWLGLEPYRDRFLDELSGGQRQRAFVAMVLCQDTDYVLLDEPLNSLDLKHATDMMRLLRRTTDELGKTVVTVLHDINNAALYADRVLAMRDGRLAFDGSAHDLMEEETLASIYDMKIAVQDFAGRRVALPYP
jgi:iron complex transport system ATP-binding protein